MSEYEIRVEGHLDSRWTAWFDGMSLTNASDGTTVIRGPVVDQSALHGLLQKLRDIGPSLISVTQVKPEEPSIQATQGIQEVQTTQTGNSTQKGTS